MNTQRLTKQFLGIVFALSSTVLAAEATAAPLPCVQRVIDWNNVNTQRSGYAEVVSLHEQGIASYTLSYVRNSSCTLPPISLSGCLTSQSSPAWERGFLSNRFVPNIFNPRQPFSNQDPLPLKIELLRAGDGLVSRLRSGNTTYDMVLQCVGDLITGDDQWGNHWTIALTLRLN
jgi:hypothetical protein